MVLQRMEKDKDNVSTHKATHKAQPYVLPYRKGLHPSRTNPDSTALKDGVSTIKEISMQRRLFQPSAILL